MTRSILLDRLLRLIALTCSKDRGDGDINFGPRVSVKLGADIPKALNENADKGIIGTEPLSQRANEGANKRPHNDFEVAGHGEISPMEALYLGLGVPRESIPGIKS